MNAPDNRRCVIYVTHTLRAEGVESEELVIRNKWDCRSEYADLSEEFAVHEGYKAASEIVFSDGTTFPIDFGVDGMKMEDGICVWLAFAEASEKFPYLDEHIAEVDDDWDLAMFQLVDFEWDCNIVKGASLAMFGCPVWELDKDLIRHLGTENEDEMPWRYTKVQYERVDI